MIRSAGCGAGRGRRDALRERGDSSAIPPENQAKGRCFMRKISKLIVVLVCLISAIGLFGACGPETGGGDTYRVTFNLSYNAPADKQIAAVEVASGETVARPADPTRDGYVFDGWYTDAVFMNEYSFDTPVTSDITLRAKWVQSTATVTYYLYGAETQTGTAQVGQPLAEPTAPTRDGYIFVGWYTDQGLTTEYDFSAAVTGNLQLYAKWQQTEATITFNLGYDGLTETDTAEIGQLVTEPTDPTREDYEFIGWYTDVQATVLYDFDTVVTGDLILYAGWNLVNATITYNYNYTGAPEPVTAKAPVGETMTAPAEPTRTGYTFGGWYRDMNCTQEFDFATDIVTNNMTLFAGWVIEEYTVTFDWNFAGSTPFTADGVEYGSAVEMPDVTPPANGNNVFVGWYTDAACTTAYDFDAPVTGDFTLYARWDAPSSGEIVITYYLNDGSGSVYYTDNSATQGMRLTAPEEPTRAGYYFAGWATGSPDGDLWNFSRNFVTGSTNLYAKWLKGYNFEAEYTDLTGKRYHGWSNDGEATPDDLVVHSERFENAADMKISNGAMIWSMLYNGASLEFEINSSVAVDDAVLVIRMSPDGFDYELDDTDWQVLVNGERLEYGHLCMPQGDEWAELEKRPLVNYVMTVSLNLKAGPNTIQLLTTNNYEHGGTYHAETPLIDCLTIYSSSTLAWEECHPENAGQTMADVDYAIEFEGDFDTNRDHAYCPLGNN